MFRDDNLARRVRSEIEAKEAERLRLIREQEEKTRKEAALTQEENRRQSELRWAASEKARKEMDRTNRRLEKEVQWGNFWHSTTSFFAGSLRFLIPTLLVALVVALIVYGELYTLREGFVTNKPYSASYVTTSCDNQGRCSSTYHPPTYGITVNYGGHEGTWSVSEEEYHQVRLGQWWCSTDFGYVCQGNGLNPPQVDPDRLTLAAEE